MLVYSFCTVPLKLIKQAKNAPEPPKGAQSPPKPSESVSEPPKEQGNPNLPEDGNVAAKHSKPTENDTEAPKPPDSIPNRPATAPKSKENDESILGRPSGTAVWFFFESRTAFV